MSAHRARRRRRARPAAAGLAVLLAALACAIGSTPAAAATGTYVRLGQLSPDQPGSELTIVPVGDAQRAVTIPAVDYGVLSDYRRIEPGEHVIAVRPAGSTGTPVVSGTFDAMPGSAYTLAAVGPKDELGLQVVSDDLTPPAAGAARVRVFQAASLVPLDIRGPGGLDLGTAVPCGEAGEYRSVPAGPLVLGVDGGPYGQVDVPVAVGANEVVSVVLVDREGRLAAEVHVDAAGPVAMPPGPIDAGFGPAADRTVGVAVLGAFAVVAAGTGAWLSRRPVSGAASGPGGTGRTH